MKKYPKRGSFQDVKLNAEAVGFQIKESYKKAIDAGDNDALINLRNLYIEQKDYEKLEELKQKYKI